MSASLSLLSEPALIRRIEFHAVFGSLIAFDGVSYISFESGHAKLGPRKGPRPDGAWISQFCEIRASYAILEATKRSDRVWTVHAFPRSNYMRVLRSLRGNKKDGTECGQFIHFSIN
jgi:hypothetical protein